MSLNTVTCWCEPGSPCAWHLAYPDRVPGDFPVSVRPFDREPSGSAPGGES